MIKGVFSLDLDNTKNAFIKDKSQFTTLVQSKKNIFTSNFIAYETSYQPHQSSAISISHHHSKFKVIAWARIDNINQLAQLLDISVQNLEECSSADIILICYLKWGKDCVQYIIGDWIFALFDEDKKDFFIAKDHFGNSCIYYYFQKDFLIFSSDIRYVLSSDKVPKVLNPNAIFQAAKIRKKDSQTAYKGVYQVPNGHFIYGSFNQIKLINYWLPINTSIPYYKNKKDYIFHFLELYQEAVRCRMKEGKTGIALSSGLDSSSVAALAAPILSSRNEVMETLTWKPKKINEQLMSKNSIGDETYLVKELVNRFNVFKMNTVEEKTGNFLKIKKHTNEIFCQPLHINSHFYDILEEAQKLGIQNLLTGNLGNFTVSNYGDNTLYFKHLLQNIYKQESINELLLWKKNNQLNTFQLLKSITSSILKPIIKKPRKSNQFNTLYAENILNPSRINEHIHFLPSTPDIDQLRINLGSPKGPIVNMFQSNLYGRSRSLYNYFGINTTAPPMDKRIVEFCTGLPNELLISNGQSKYILKQAMHDKLPHTILYNRKRGRQQSGLIKQFQFEKKELEETLNQLKKSPLVNHWLSIASLKYSLNFITSSHSKNAAKLFSHINTFSIGLSIGLFLQQFEEKYGG